MLFEVWLGLIVAIVILAASTVTFSLLVLYYRTKHKAHLEQRKVNILEDLSLATSDQLLEELRKRSGRPYILLMPIDNEASHGLVIEVHNVPPSPCLSMLHMATTLTFNELKKRGIDVPDLPSFGDDKEDWENSHEES